MNDFLACMDDALARIYAINPKTPVPVRCVLRDGMAVLLCKDGHPRAWMAPEMAEKLGWKVETGE